MKHMKHNLRLNIVTLIGFILISLSGCDKNYISPYTELEKDIVVTCMIDTRNEVNLLRIQNLYLNSNDNKKAVDISAILAEGSGEDYHLRDTLLNNDDRFTFFYIPGSYLHRGKYYRLTVKSKQSGEKWADCFIPPNPDLICYGYWTPTRDPRYELRIEFSKNIANYFVLRVFIEYEINYQGSKQLKRREIPGSIVINQINPHYSAYKELWEYKENEVDTVLYPGIQSSNVIENNSLGDIITGFRKVYTETLVKFRMNNLENNVPPENITVKGTVAVFYSIDKNYYDLFMTKTNEQFSIRLDQASYPSNIQGANFKGYGFFGAMATDTARCKAEEYFIKQFGYVNGQKQ